jgi:transposase
VVEGVHDAEKEKAVTAGFSQQFVALVRAGRTPEDLAREFEPTAQSVSN